MDPATSNSRARRRHPWTRALRIQVARFVWTVRQRFASARRDEHPARTELADSAETPLPRSGEERDRRWWAGGLTVARAAQIQMRRAALRLPQPSGRNRSWTVAAATGIAGIVLLFLMYLSQRDAALAAVEPRRPQRTEPELEPEPRLGTAVAQSFPAPEDEEPPPFEADPVVEAPPVIAVPVAVEEPAEEPVPDLPPLELELVRLPADSPHEFLVEAASALDAFITGSATLLPDDWSRLQPARLEPSPEYVRYSERLSPDLLQQLSAEIEAPAEPTAAEASSGLNIAIEKTAPDTANAGELLKYEIVVRNDGEQTTAHTLIEEQLPANQQVIEVSPRGLLDGQTLRWQVRELRPGEEQRIRLQVLPTAEGPAPSVAVVQPYAAVSASTLVQSLRVELNAAAPERVLVGEICTIDFRITNAGTAPVSGAVLRVDLPDQMAHGLGRRLDHDIGDLAPGESREVPLAVLAESPGTAEPLAELVADGDVRIQTAQPIEVVAPSLQVRRWGVPQATVGETATFANRVINKGPEPLTSVELIELVPAGFEVIEVLEGGEFDPDTRQARWTIAEIAPGETVECPLRLRATEPGELRTVLEARTSDETTGPVPAGVTAVPAAARQPHRSITVPCSR